MFKIGWFSTGRGQGSLNLLRAVVDAIGQGNINAEIAYVFCSREPGDAEGSDRYIRQVHDYGLKAVCFSSKRFKPELRTEGKRNPEAMNRWRLAYDEEIMKRVDGRGADICVLAGYMLVVGPRMCAAYDMINLHPAAPGGPAGTWQEVIRQLIKERAAESGNMMHLVIEELDQGPPISYVTFPLRGPDYDELWRGLEQKLKNGTTLPELTASEGEQNPLFLQIRREGARREIPLVVQTVRAFAEGRLRLEQKKIIADGKLLPGPYCLNSEIEKQLDKRL